MASLFVIREKNTNKFCTSSKFAYFDADLQNAAMFNKRENAEKAAREMLRKNAEQREIEIVEAQLTIVSKSV